MANPVLQAFLCDETSIPDAPLVGGLTAFRWVDGTGPVGPPPPEVLAAVLYVRVEALMVAPEVVSDPPVASPAIVRLPVFVAVSNWQGQIVDSETVPGMTVTMTATPSLVFKPGEPGSGSVACVGSGTRFDPSGPPAGEQAQSPGACAWAYQLRSGAGDRPAEWSSEVTVNWAVRWEASNGDSGVMPGLSFSATVPRLVNEVQTVVVDDE